MDSHDELKDFFEQYDVLNKWGMTADQATSIVFNDDETQLFAHTVDEFSERALMRLEFAAYEAKNVGSEFTIDKNVTNAIREALKKNPNSQRAKLYVDLSDERKVTLPDGTVMPINRHG